MIIKSSFKDYYDCVQSLGRDQSLVYNRYIKTQTITNTTITKHFYKNDKAWYIPKEVFPHRIYQLGFCGRIYPIIKLRDSAKFFYSVEELDNYVLKSCSKQEQKDYFKKLSKFFWKQAAREFFKKIFIDIKNFYKQDEEYKKLFIDNYCPIFLLEYKLKEKEVYITSNTELKKLDFFRIINAYVTFQEISMFLGNIAMPIKPIPKIDDKIMLEAKGFDKRLSFRKDKQK